MPCSHCKQKGHNIRTCKYTDCTYTVLKNIIRSYNDKFEGMCKDGKPCGVGRYTWPNGDVVYGIWDNTNVNQPINLKDGFAKKIWNSRGGDIYEGGYKKGYETGKGKYTWKNGDIYDGLWKRAKRHGEGIMKWSNGIIYNGLWKNDNMHGKGCMTLKNGTKQMGKWKYGKKYGIFKITDINGNTSETIFVNDVENKNNYNKTIQITELVKDECSICKDTIDDQLTMTECGHYYHTKCLFTWFKNGNNNCPMCRSVLV